MTSYPTTTLAGLCSLIPARLIRRHRRSKPITQEQLETLPREILHQILYHTYDDFTVPVIEDAEILQQNFLDQWLTQNQSLIAKKTLTILKTKIFQQIVYHSGGHSKSPAIAKEEVLQQNVLDQRLPQSAQLQLAKKARTILKTNFFQQILYHTCGEFKIPDITEEEVLQGDFLDQWLTRSAELNLAKQAWTATLKARYPALEDAVIYAAQKVYMRINAEEAERLEKVRKIQRAKLVSRERLFF